MWSKSCTDGGDEEVDRGAKMTDLQCSIVAADEVERSTAMEWDECIRNWWPWH